MPAQTTPCRPKRPEGGGALASARESGHPGRQPQRIVAAISCQESPSQAPNGKSPAMPPSQNTEFVWQYGRCKTKNHSKYDAINKKFRKTKKTQLTGRCGFQPRPIPSTSRPRSGRTALLPSYFFLLTSRSSPTFLPHPLTTPSPYRRIASSLVSSPTPSALACASNIRSNGSRCSHGNPPTCRA